MSSTPMYVWDGSAKVSPSRGDMQVWDGSALVQKPMYVWDGSAKLLIWPQSIAAPTGLAVAQNASSPESALDVSWDAAHADEILDTWRIERAPDSSGSPGTWSEVHTQGASDTTWTDTGLSSDTTYWYRVRGYLSGTPDLYGSYCSAVSGTTASEVPAAPTDLTATKDATYPWDRIDLAWTDNSSNETGFKIERSDDGGSTYSQIDTVGADVTTYEDSGLDGETQYYYRVRAYNAAGNSDYSNVDSATTDVDPPAAPSNVSNSQIAATTVRVQWTDESDNETTWLIQRRSRAPGGSWGSYSALDFMSTSDEAGTGGTETYDDTTVSESTEYQYRVAAQNTSGTSSYTEAAGSVCVSTTPGAPTDVSAVLDGTNPDDDVDLSWTDPTTGTHDNTEIHYSETSGFTPDSGTLVDTVAAGTTTYDHNGIGVGTVSAPTGVSVSVVSDTELDVSWDPVIDATEYKVHRSTSSGFTPGSGNLVGTVTVESFSDSGLNPDTTYYYKVIAVVDGPTYYYKVVAINDCGDSATSTQDGVTFDDGESPASSEASGTTWPTVPKDFTATHDSAACPTIQVDLSWDNGNRSEQKTLEVYNNSTASWDVVDNSIAAAATTYADHQPTADQIDASDNVDYRIKFNSETSYATTTVNALCPE